VSPADCALKLPVEPTIAKDSATTFLVTANLPLKRARIFLESPFQGNITRVSPNSPLRSDALAIVRRWGWNVTAYQILNPGFELWINPELDAAVGYIERHRIRVVGGAPVCADEQLPRVVTAFENDAARAGCGVVYFCAEQRLAELAAADVRRITFPIGAQPMWTPRDLLSEFEQHASLRAQLNRARNKGVRVQSATHLDTITVSEMNQCLEQWIDDRGLPPLHFLIETRTLDNLQDRAVFVALRDASIVGFLVATPIPARNGWLVEQIVRGKNAPNGTAETLLREAALKLESMKADMITLGLAPLAQRGEPRFDRSPRWLHVVLDNLRSHGHRFYNFEGLEAFKAKFGRADWAPVYAVLAPNTPLPRALLAITAAFAGEPLRRFLPRVLTRGLAHELRLARPR
jgi:phosphatidylglycerol lysyltransferase